MARLRGALLALLPLVAAVAAAPAAGAASLEAPATPTFDPEALVEPTLSLAAQLAHTLFLEHGDPAVRQLADAVAHLLAAVPQVDLEPDPGPVLGLAQEAVALPLALRAEVEGLVLRALDRAILALNNSIGACTLQLDLSHGIRRSYDALHRAADAVSQTLVVVAGVGFAAATQAVLAASAAVREAVVEVVALLAVAAAASVALGAIADGAATRSVAAAGHLAGAVGAEGREVARAVSDTFLCGFRWEGFVEAGEAGAEDARGSSGRLADAVERLGQRAAALPASVSALRPSSPASAAPAAARPPRCRCRGRCTRG